MLERADWVLHLTHELLPVVGYDVAVVLDRLQIVEVILTHVDLQLTDVRLGSCNSEQALGPQKVRVLAEVSSQQPEDERDAITVRGVKQFELGQIFTKDVRCALFLLATVQGVLICRSLYIHGTEGVITLISAEWIGLVLRICVPLMEVGLHVVLR